MRVRIATLAVVLLAALGFDASPAAAGGYSSTTCFDGSGGVEVPLLTTPITVGMEVFGTANSVDICYATSPVGYSGSEITGGRITIARYDYGWATAVSVQCLPDSSTTVTTACLGVGVATDNGTVSVGLNWATVDTTLTSPTTLVGTGATFFSPLDWGGRLLLPCVVVNFTHLVPTCGTPLT